MAVVSIKNIISGFIAVLIAITVAEIFLRYAVGEELLFETWFTPGVHLPNTRFGFQYQTNYQGYMWHPDGVWGVPLQTDAYGYRLPVSGSRNSKAYQIDIIGGASMMMGYGLPDAKTIHGQAAAAAKHNLEIHNTAWPGFDVYRNWHLYRATLATERTPEVLIIGIVNNKPAEFAWLPADYRSLPSPPPKDVLFRFFDGLVLPPSSDLQFHLGSNYYRTFLGFKVLRTAESLYGKLQQSVFAADVSEVATSESETELSMEGLKRFTGFIKYLHRRMSSLGTQTLLVFLPFENLGKDFYDKLETSLSADQPSINLHRVLFDDIQTAEFIADGHYDKQLSALIGQHIAQELDRLLDKSP